MENEEDKKKSRRILETPQRIRINEPIPEPFDPSPLLARIDTLENKHKLLNDAVEFVKSTNWFILAVLFLGFITLLVAFISLIVQVTNSNTTTQIEFIKAINELKYEITNPKPTLIVPDSTNSAIKK